MNITERINSCLPDESPMSNAGNILNEFKVSELEKVLAYFIEKYETRKDLLAEFWSHKSDACPIDHKASDDQIISFKRFVISKDMSF